MTIDDRLPYGTKTTLFLRQTKDHAYWPHMAEKLYAKINANYEYIGWGWMNEAFYIWTGVPSVMIKPKSLTTDQLWDVMVDANSKNFIFSAACMLAQKGIVGGHAYSVLGMQPIYSANGTLVARLVLTRNPWGNTEFNGDWSDSSSLWTAAYKA
jgi:Calpain family cysteine protease